MDRLLSDLNAALTDSQWLAGSEISLADIGIVPYVVRIEHLAMTMMMEGRSDLRKWLDRVKSRPAYGRSLERWFNTDYLTLSAAKGAESLVLIAKMIGS